MKAFQYNNFPKGYKQRVNTWGVSLLKPIQIYIEQYPSKGNRFYMVAPIHKELRKFFSGRHLKRSCGSLKEVSTYAEAKAK